MAAVLLSEICRNRPFSEGVGHYVRIFFIYGPLDRGMMWLQLFRWTFSHKKICSRQQAKAVSFFETKCSPQKL